MNKISYKFKYFLRYLLKLYFDFDKWHIAPISGKIYIQRTILFLNSISITDRQKFCDIGCGLGDLIRNVNYKLKHGFDSDKNVLNAARFLNFFQKNKISYNIFIFPDNNLLEVNYNVISLINWIHHISPEILKNNIEKYFNINLTPNGLIIIDTVSDPNYKFNHDINFIISNLNCEIILIGEFERGRKIWAIKKI
jgi:2-polyprenyl-3-methyl-5-hydroxy-6-metoxy-1,4-benzoquinol methylase